MRSPYPSSRSVNVFIRLSDCQTMRGEGYWLGADFLLLYASQTGNARGIAEDLYEQCVSGGLKCQLKCCSEVDKDFLINVTCLVLVASTTGDGDPPDTARRFWRGLNHQTPAAATPFTGLSYTVLGLGDTNHTNFCNFGKSLDRRLQALGAERFYPCGWADDGTGLEIVVEPWIEGLLPALRSHLASTPSSPQTTPSSPHTTPSSLHTTLEECAVESLEIKEMDRRNDKIETDTKDIDEIDGRIGRDNNRRNDDKIDNTRIDDKINDTRIDDKETDRRDDNMETVRGSVETSSEVGSSSSDNLVCVDSSVLMNTLKMEEGRADNKNINDNLILTEDEGNTDKNGNTVELIAAKYNVDLLPLRALQNLSVKSCALPQDSKLTLPVLPPPYLAIRFLKDTQENATKSPNDAEQDTMKYSNDSWESTEVHSPSFPYPSAASEPVRTQITSVRQLTRDDALKTTLEVTLSLPRESKDKFEYKPGDSFGVLVKNPKLEVEILLHLLGIREKADLICELSVLPDTKKKSAVVPGFIPNASTLRNIFECSVDIRAVPKKPFLRALVEHTSDSGERRRLQELVSKEGTEEYSRHVRGASLSTLDLLIIFKSCQPPVTTLLEHLPRLLPRAYSAISSPLVNPLEVSFAFNIIEIPRIDSVTFSRRGICTGWLASLMEKNSSGLQGTASLTDRELDSEDISQAMEKLSVSEEQKTCADNMDQTFGKLSKDQNMYVCIYCRTNQNFHLPQDPTTPIIMVGPGTGVVPFVGFLRHREKVHFMDTGLKFGESWLFYGCRHKERDFLYKDELERFRDSNILSHLIVSFSRDEINGGAKYVQDNIIKHGEAVAKLIVDSNAVVYVCGDARNMAKDVFEAFVTVLATHVTQSDFKPREFLARMQIQRRYLQDVWA